MTENFKEFQNSHIPTPKATKTRTAGKKHFFYHNYKNLLVKQWYPI